MGEGFSLSTGVERFDSRPGFARASSFEHVRRRSHRLHHVAVVVPLRGPLQPVGTEQRVVRVHGFDPPFRL